MTGYGLDLLVSCVAVCHERSLRRQVDDHFQISHDGHIQPTGTARLASHTACSFQPGDVNGRQHPPGLSFGVYDSVARRAATTAFAAPWPARLGTRHRQDRRG